MKKIFVLGFMLLISLKADAALKVTPTVIELNANKARGNYITTSFDVRGGDNETIRFKVYPSYFEITEDGKMNELSASSSKNSLVSCARFIPNEFTLKNGTPQKVRVTITDLKNLPDGESRMVLFLEDVVAKEIFLPYGNSNVTTKLLVKTRVGVPIYVDKGKFIKQAEFNDLTINNNDNNLTFGINLTSKGNSKIRYNGKAQIIKNKELIEEFPINSNTIKDNGYIKVTQEIPIEKIKECGEYKLRAIITYENEKNSTKNLVKESAFSVTKISKSKI